MSVGSGARRFLAFDVFINALRIPFKLGFIVTTLFELVLGVVVSPNNPLIRAIVAVMICVGELVAQVCDDTGQCRLVAARARGGNEARTLDFRNLAPGFGADSAVGTGSAPPLTVRLNWRAGGRK